jgi:hypothetical protein
VGGYMYCIDIYIIVNVIFKRYCIEGLGR